MRVVDNTGPLLLDAIAVQPEGWAVFLGRLDCPGGGRRGLGPALLGGFERGPTLRNPGDCQSLRAWRRTASSVARARPLAEPVEKSDGRPDEVRARRAEHGVVAALRDDVEAGVGHRSGTY